MSEEYAVSTPSWRSGRGLSRGKREVMLDELGRQMQEHVDKLPKAWTEHLTGPTNVLESRDADLSLYIEEFDYTQEWLKTDKSAAFGENRRRPVLRTVCCTEDGYTGVLYIHGFLPYFYARIPSSIVESYLGKQWVAVESDRVIANPDALNHGLRSAPGASDLLAGFKAAVEPHLGDLLYDVELCFLDSVEFYRPTRSPFLKLTFTVPSAIPTCRDLLYPPPKAILDAEHEAGRVRRQPPPSKPLFLWGAYRRLELFECNVDFPLRFMVDKSTSGCSWVTLAGGKWTLSARSLTLYAYEINVSMEDVTCHPTTVVPWNRIPKRCVLSFDIECAGRRGHFPKPNQDPVVMIAMTRAVIPAKGGGVGGAESKEGGLPLSTVVLTLGRTLPVPDVHLICVEDERELLRLFAILLRIAAPHILTGYNIDRFDCKYLTERIRHLGLDGDDALMWGRLAEPVRVEEIVFKSAGTGAQKRVNVLLPGVVVLDMYRVALQTDKLRSYTLNAVAYEYLKQTKNDLHHSLITPMTCGPKATPATRQNVLRYVHKDAVLPILLMERLRTIVLWIERARVTCTSLSTIILRGQQGRFAMPPNPEQVYTGVLEELKMSDEDIAPDAVPEADSEESEEAVFSMEDQDEADRLAAQDGSFTGATVIPPKQGFYGGSQGGAKQRVAAGGASAVATLDYNSLYPSIMQGFNVCYTTLILPGEEGRIPREKRYCVLSNKKKPAWFVTSEVLVGVLPTILIRLLDARSVAKKDMEECERRKDRDGETINDGRQLALKIAANSVYGYTSANDLPRPEVSAAVTWFGRQLIHFAATIVETDLLPSLKELDVKTAVAQLGEDEKDVPGVVSQHPKLLLPGVRTERGTAPGVWLGNVIYGDTDSIMFTLGTMDIAGCIAIGQHAATLINERLKRWR